MKTLINNRTQHSHKGNDTLKWVFVITLFFLGIGANYYWHELVWSLRFSLGLVLACVMLALVAYTKKGKAAWNFAGEARIEMRKVVWPAQKETVQVAVMIVVVVFIMAIILWCVDSSLMWIISKLTG